jgi:hypothetical protein
MAKLETMAFQNVKVGSLSPQKLESVIDDTAARFGKLCESMYKKAARELLSTREVGPDMDVETLVTRSVSRALRIPAKEEQGESEPVGPAEPVGPQEPEPTFAVYIKDDEMEDTA